MKYAVIIGDGMADRPITELGSKTPLQAASTPNMDTLASEGTIGMVSTIPEGLQPGSDIANLSILGYDPEKFYSGRAPLEAASIGIDLKDNDVAYRCNLVTLKYNADNTMAVMDDHSSGHISTDEAGVLLNEVDKSLGTSDIKFYKGVSYRHLMVWSGGESEVECIPPHDILGKQICDYLPVGRGEEVLRELMYKSVVVLKNHSVNKNRIKQGKKPANSIWLWGQGKKPQIPAFKEKYSLDGALVSAVDLTKGLGIYAGFEILNVPGLTGWIDTNYIGKAEASLKALEKVDLVYIHVEAPDEAGHSGNYKDKVKAIEDFDKFVVGTVMRGLKKFKDYRILLMPDHPTPIELRTHSSDPVPFVIFDSRQTRRNKNVSYDESIAKKKDIKIIDNGHTLMDYFIKG
ncbi:MAG: cofactor-independent phosphoglycerate mutase [Nitrospiraceae bacterium]|nr:cofactor-independent phosphoglycerate mutase [Nitrospiraceae bacterium]